MKLSASITLYLALITCALIHCGSKSTVEEDVLHHFHSSEHHNDIIHDEVFHKVYKKLKIKEKKAIDKELFKKFFMMFVVGDEKVSKNEKKLYARVIDKISEDVPNTFPSEHLVKYLDEDKFIHELNEISPYDDYKSQKEADKAAKKEQRKAEKSDL